MSRQEGISLVLAAIILLGDGLGGSLSVFLKGKFLTKVWVALCCPSTLWFAIPPHPCCVGR